MFTSTLKHCWLIDLLPCQCWDLVLVEKNCFCWFHQIQGTESAEPSPHLSLICWSCWSAELSLLTVSSLTCVQSLSSLLLFPRQFLHHLTQISTLTTLIQPFLISRICCDLSLFVKLETREVICILYEDIYIFEETVFATISLTNQFPVRANLILTVKIWNWEEELSEQKIDFLIWMRHICVKQNKILKYAVFRHLNDLYQIVLN